MCMSINIGNTQCLNNNWELNLIRFVYVIEIKRRLYEIYTKRKKDK